MAAIQPDAFSASQLSVLERIAKGAPLPVLLEAVVRLIEAQADGMLCSILLLDRENACVRAGAAPSLPPQCVLAFDGAKIGPQAGSCGAAAFLGERVVVEDIATHPNWTDYKHVALPHGLRACWSSPIFSPEREVLGTFAMYYLDRRGPTEQEIAWVDVAAHLASIAIDRDRVEAQQRKLEAQVQQAERMQALGTFAGGIAHDFNNILTAIRGHAEIAAHPGIPAETVNASLKEITIASRRAADLVRQIATFGRNAEPKRELLALELVTEEAVKLLRATLPSTLQIQTRFAERTPQVSADPTQVHQLIMNLGTNAMHAMKEHGGTITIALEAVTLPADLPTGLAKGRYVRLTVSDQGCGMDAVTAERAFEPFFSTKGIGQGTGLGLAVVHGIMKSHQGVVTVDSEPGRGTTFRLYFQAVEHAGSSETAEVDVHASGQGEHVLYVDDDDALVFLCTRMLRRLGYRATGFAAPFEALAHFRDHASDFDAVVCDINMPGLRGVELIRQIRALRPEVRVVLVSGFVSPADVLDARALGIEHVVPKPQTIEDLAHVLHTLIGG